MNVPPAADLQKYNKRGNPAFGRLTHRIKWLSVRVGVLISFLLLIFLSQMLLPPIVVDDHSEPSLHSGTQLDPQLEFAA